MATGLLPNGEQTFVDADGKPLAAGLVYFYIPNTETFKDTWQDRDKNALNDNPVTLDSAGRATIWGEGVYRQIVQDVFGNLQWDKVTEVSGDGSGTINPVILDDFVITMLEGIYPIDNGSAGPITIIMPTDPADGANGMFYDVGGNAGTYPITFQFGAKFVNTAPPGHNWSTMSDGEAVKFTWLADVASWVVG